MHYRFLLVAAIGLAACRESDAVAPRAEGVWAAAARADSHASLPHGELAQAKAAAGRYHDIRQAIADGYHDTGIVLPNMGRHFINDGLLDAAFDADHPELLVYSPDSSKLLAVEYAVPIALSPQAPEGFQGSQDQWVQFGGALWTLHAWVYKENPDGVFSPTNSRVQ
jgi:hypothetical protein